jgi:hypothetical protein
VFVKEVAHVVKKVSQVDRRRMVVVRRLEMRYATCWEDGKAGPCRYQEALRKDSDTVEG